MSGCLVHYFTTINIMDQSKKPRCYYCVLPRHASALISTTSSSSSKGILGRLLIETAIGTTDRNVHEDDALPDDGDERACRIGHRDDAVRHYDLLTLQCHSEGVLWRGLFLLLFPTMMGRGSENCAHHRNISHKRDKCEPRSIACRRRRGQRKETSTIAQARRAFSILTNHFRNHVRRIRAAVGADDDDGSNDTPCEVFHTCIDGRAEWSTMERFRDSNDDEGNNVPVILLLLPPNSPINQRQNELRDYSRRPSTGPTNQFALRLITNENNLIRLTSLSAYISTLGGGFFLCRYLSTAISLARRQCAIALMRGDCMMALKCRINEGYCYIHGGRLNKGKKVIRRVLRDTVTVQADMGISEKEDGLLNHTPEVELSEIVIIKNMCHSALRFADLIREVSTGAESRSGGISLQNDDRSDRASSDGRRSTMDGSQKEKVISTTHDDFQRIRIVQDRRWR